MATIGKLVRVVVVAEDCFKPVRPRGLAFLFFAGRGINGVWGFADSIETLEEAVNYAPLWIWLPKR
jgi:hypothetical protein